MKSQIDKPVSNTGTEKKPTRLKEILTDGLLALIVWNVLFIITSIPIITIGPSMAALGFCTNALVTDSRPQRKCAKLYFKAFKASFLKALPIGIYFLFVTILFGAGFFVYSYLSPENSTYVSMSSLSLVILSLFWGVMMHIYPLMFDFEQTDWETTTVVMRKIKLPALAGEACRKATEELKNTALALVFSVLLLGLLIILMPTTIPLFFTAIFSAIAMSAALAHTPTPY